MVIDLKVKTACDAKKQGDKDVQRLLENRPVSGGIQILPAAGDRAPDLCDSLFSFELFNFELLKCQLLGCADRGVYHIELIGSSHNDSDLPRPSPLS